MYPQTCGQFLGESLPKFNHPWVDESHAPILICEGPRTPSDEELNSYLKRLEEWSKATRSNYAWVIRPCQLTASQRKSMVDTLKRLKPYHKRHQLAIGLAVDNTVIRGILTAVFWFAPQSMPHAVFVTKDDAFRWVTEQLQHLIQAERSKMLPLYSTSKGCEAADKRA